MSKAAKLINTNGTSSTETELSPRKIKVKASPSTAVAEIVFIAGLALVTAGSWIVYHPAALILIGICFMVFAAGAVNQKRDNNK